MYNQLELASGGFEDDGTKVYTGRNNRGTGAGRGFSSVRPDLPGSNGKSGGSGSRRANGNSAFVRWKNAALSFFRRIPEKARLTKKQRWWLALILKYLLAAALISGSYVWTAYRAEKKAWAEAEQYFKAQYEAQLQAYKDEQAAAALLTGDASKQAAKEREADLIAKALYPIGNMKFNADDLRTYCWAILLRQINAEYPDSIESILLQKDQFMGFSEKNPIIEEYYQIALEMLDIYYDGRWPTTADYVWAEWPDGKIVLRNAYKADRNTNYWWWGK